MRVALAIPAFNSAATVDETITSVLKQPHLSELVDAVYLADDASTDPTVARVEKTWTSEVSLNVIRRQANMGERRNLNSLIETLSAQWILILHADDIATPDWLREMSQVMESAPSDVGTICSSWDTLLNDGSIAYGERVVDNDYSVIPGVRQAVTDTLGQGCWWHISGCAIRARCFEDVGPFDEDLPQLGDWDWLMRCLGGRWGVAYVPRPLIIYRQHAETVSASSFRSGRDMAERLLLYDRYASYLDTPMRRRLLTQQLCLIARRVGAWILTRRRFQIGSHLSIFTQMLMLLIRPGRLGTSEPEIRAQLDRIGRSTSTKGRSG